MDTSPWLKRSVPTIARGISLRNGPVISSDRLMFALLSALLLLCAGVGGPAIAAAPKVLRTEIAAFIEEMARKHQFDRGQLRQVFARVQPRPAIVRAMSAPSTAQPWYRFRTRYIDDARIAGGVRFWQQHAAVVARASREFGVPPEIIVATIGVETLYGRNTGSFKVIEALTTLAFDYPPRAEFFRDELEQFLLLARGLGIDPASMRGSYAGAIGIPQFLPSSYRKYAVDYDGNGRADLAGAPADAIGSVANYYRAFGWELDGAIAVRVDADETVLDAMLAAGIKPHVTVGDLRQRGVVATEPVRDDAEAALFSLETAAGVQYWIGLQNFYVITRYNRSVNYAMVVYELARELRSAMQQQADGALRR